MLDKPNTLPLTDFVLLRAAATFANVKMRNESALVPLLEYQALVEEIRGTYMINEQAGQRTQVPLYADHLMSKVDAWRSSLPTGLANHGLMLTRYQAAKIRVYEMGLLFRIRTSGLDMATDLPVATKNGLLSNMWRCVIAIKGYLDDFLGIDASIYESLPYEEWCRIMTTFFILYKLSAGARELPDWDVRFCRRLIDMEAYLNIVSQRVRYATLHSGAPDSTSTALFHMLPDILDSVNQTYADVKDDPMHPGLGARPHKDLSKLALTKIRSEQREPPMHGSDIHRSESINRCPASAIWASQALSCDHATTWQDVHPRSSQTPSSQLAANESMWSELLDTG